MCMTQESTGASHYSQSSTETVGEGLRPKDREKSRK